MKPRSSPNPLNAFCGRVANIIVQKCSWLQNSTPLHNDGFGADRQINSVFSDVVATAFTATNTVCILAARNRLLGMII
jgi:hypothetical protein